MSTVVSILPLIGSVSCDVISWKVLVLTTNKLQQLGELARNFKPKFPLRRLPRFFPGRGSFEEVGVMEFGLYATLSPLFGDPCKHRAFKCILGKVG